MLGGWAAVLAMKAAKVYRVAAVMCLGLFLWGSVRRAHQQVNYYQLLSLSVKQLISDVSQARNLHPTKTIVLTSVPEMIFHLSIAHEAFRLVHLFDIYLAPGHDHISPKPGSAPVEKFVLSKQNTLRAVQRKNIVGVRRLGTAPRRRDAAVFGSGKAQAGIRLRAANARIGIGLRHGDRSLSTAVDLRPGQPIAAQER